METKSLEESILIAVLCDDNEFARKLIRKLLPGELRRFNKRVGTLSDLLDDAEAEIDE